MGNNGLSLLSVMEALALCAMHFLRQRNKLSNRVCYVGGGGVEGGGLFKLMGSSQHNVQLPMVT